MTTENKRKPNTSIKWLFIGCGGLIFIAVIVLVLVYRFTVRPLFITIAPDEVGVVISPHEMTGYVEEPLTPGNHMIRPLEQVEIYNISRTVYSSSSTDCDCYSNEPRSVTLHTIDGEDLIIDYQLTYTIYPEQAVHIYREWQHRYQEGFVIPESKQITQQLVSQYTSNEIALTKRDEIEQAIFSRLKSDFSSSGFLLLAFKIEDVRLNK